MRVQQGTGIGVGVNPPGLIGICCTEIAQTVVVSSPDLPMP